MFGRRGLNPLTIVTKFTRIYPARVENAAAPLRLKSDAETGDEDDDNVGVGVGSQDDDRS